MTTLSRFDVAITLYPFIDRDVSKPRPCLIVSADTFRDDEAAVIAAMITTASRSRWASDLRIEDLDSAGLRAASVVRWKLFTLDLRLIAGKVGALSKADAKRAEKSLRSVLDL